MKKKLPASEHKDRNFSLKIDYRERRRLEMKRRIGVLHHKRSCLERELSAIKVALVSLDQQMQRDAAYDKLSI